YQIQKYLLSATNLLPPLNQEFMVADPYIYK
ncbi:MAG: hypothetical protein RIR48_3156, partial [Bacteroidota bacterium]